MHPDKLPSGWDKGGREETNAPSVHSQIIDLKVKGLHMGIVCGPKEN